jgi:hypothetical protein
MNVMEQEASLMLIDGRAKFTVTLVKPFSHLNVRSPIAVAIGSLLAGTGR